MREIELATKFTGAVTVGPCVAGGGSLRRQTRSHGAMTPPPSNRLGRSYHFALAIKFEHYEVESVPDALEVKLPTLFSLQHRHQISDSVTLFDHRGNEFEVAIVKRGCELFLSNGWRQVGRCLGLHEGGWMKMIYVSSGKLFIEARDRLCNAPFCLAPPRVLRLNAEPRMVQIGEAAIPPLDPSVFVGRKPTVVMAFYATLKKADVTTPVLHLPCDFCNVVFPPTDFDVTVVGEDGKAWTCTLIKPTAHTNSDILLRGWNAIVEAYDLQEDFPYKLEVAVETSNLIFFSGH